MNKFLILLSHTFMTQFKSKSFLISTAIIAVFIAISFNLSGIISLFDREAEEEIVEVGIVDASDSIQIYLDQWFQINDSCKFHSQHLRMRHKPKQLWKKT